MSKKSKEQTIIDTQSPDFAKVMEDTIKYMEQEIKGSELPPDVQNQIVDECIKAENQINNIPPKVFKRNEYGLLENTNYVFNEDGTVNWRKMIPIEFLYVNPDPNKRAAIEKKYGKKFEEINLIEDKIDDCDLVITLFGLRSLLRMRGFDYVEMTIKEANETYAAVSCCIGFIGNYETFGQSVTFTDNACAHVNNTNGFGRNYLLELASNRALCRTIRSFLCINIVSREEISGNKNDIQESEPVQDDLPYQILEKLMKEKGLNFDRIKKKCVIENVTGAENFNTIKDIPKATVSNLIGKLNKYKPE